MQGLLARLKSSTEPTSLDTGLLNGCDGLGGKQLMVNNFINHDGDNADYPHSLESTLTVRSNFPDNSSDTNQTEEIYAIEAVMASNSFKAIRDKRVPSSASSSKLTGRTGKNRSSRVSLNSVTLSEREDLDTSGMDSDDDTINTSRSQLMSTTQLWAQFENAVKSIDNSDPDLFIKKPKPSFLSSETFQKVMVDMYGNTEYGNTKGYTLLKQKLGNMARSTTLASRMLSGAVMRGQADREREEEERNSNENNQSTTNNSMIDYTDDATKTSAKRGWRMVKRQVQEQVMEQKTQTTKVNWNMISHTVKQMSNMEKTRQDLYERYGIVPTTLDDGTVICENRMLSERARLQLYGSKKDGQENKRPLSYQPPPTFLRTKSKINTHNNFASDYRRNNLNNKKLVKRRPKTAISIL